jgi:ubiquinone/menaquinone biosynthesis C-methylase UbiE
MSRYGKVAYWNERYSFKNECYEWFESYDGICHLLTCDMLSPADGVSTSRPRRTIQVRDRDGNLVPRSIVCMDESPRLAPTKFPPREDCRVLILGCGNSALGEAMLKDGWTGGIHNVDFSSVVIEQMKKRYDEAFYKELETSYKNTAGSNNKNSNNIKPMEFVCADVTSPLPFEDGSFDLIVCKGTLDAILSSAGSIASAKKMMHECCRLLADEHGALVIVSHASPDNRLVFFENTGDEWWAGLNVHHLHKERNTSTSESTGASDVYVYTCRKRTGGGKKTRPRSYIADSVAPLVRSSSNEENEQVDDCKTSVKKLSPRDDTKEKSRALVQVQVSA